MTVSLADLKEYVNPGGTATTDDAFLTTCLAEATELISVFIGTVVVPSVVKDRAVKETASELYHRRNAPNGLSQFASFDGTPIRVARDPMVGAYPILGRYMVIGL
jgi:hypothetical protein